MAIRSEDNEWVAWDALRELASRQGEAFEAYAHALKGYGAGSLPAEALAREVINLTARGTVDVVRISLALAQDCYYWAWSLAGVRIDAGSGRIPESASYAPRTASSSRWTTSKEE